MTLFALNTRNLFYKVIFSFEYLAMQTKPIVYVSRITNLSDARYCAGMGVDMLGFLIDPSHPDYVSPSAYLEMIGWVSGPRRVVEITEGMTPELDEVMASYAPDFIHVNAGALPHVGNPPVPLLVSMDGPAQVLPHNNIAFIIRSAEQSSAEDKSGLEFLIALQHNVSSPMELLNRTGAAGFALQGSRETSPGLKDYDHLSKILEELDK